MTIQQYRQIQTDNQGYYSFRLYTGEDKTGIITDNGGRNPGYYIVSVPNIKLLNEDRSVLPTIGYKVSLEGIDSFEKFSMFDRSSPFDSFKNANTLDRLMGRNEDPPPPLGAKKMIILGAGASFDFTFDPAIKDDVRPPLTNHLFDDRFDDILDRYPGAKQLASPLLMATDIERFFQDKWDMIKEHYAPEQMNQLINTQYYLQHLFSELSTSLKKTKRSNYTNLVNLADEHMVRSGERILITSFNYDTLLEAAITQHYGYGFNELSDYIDAKRKMILFKPHGSWNWIRQFKTYSIMSMHRDERMFSEILFEEKRTYAQIFKDLEDNIRINNELPLNKSEDRDRPFLPQLLIPFTDKDEFVMPEAHRGMLEQNLGTLEEILIIGWKGTEQRFKTLLGQMIGNKSIKITAVTNSDKTVQSALLDVLPAASWNFEGTFTEYMQSCMKSKKLF